MDKITFSPVIAIFKSLSDTSTAKDRYVSVLKASGIEAVAVPTLSFQFQVDHLVSCLQKPEAFSGFILTSQRSVESIRYACDRIGSELPESWKTKRHFCVGMQTRDTAINLLGLSELIGHECGNADQLGLVIVKEIKSGQMPLLFPCSSLKMDTLPRLMTENRIAFETVISYVTVAHPQLDEFIADLRDRRPNCLVFFSPSGVEFTLPLLAKRELLTQSKIISIGYTTCAALEKAAIRVDQVCVKPTPEHLLEAVKMAFN